MDAWRRDFNVSTFHEVKLAWTIPVPNDHSKWDKYKHYKQSERRDFLELQLQPTHHLQQPPKNMVWKFENSRTDKCSSRISDQFKISWKGSSFSSAQTSHSTTKWCQWRFYDDGSAKESTGITRGDCWNMRYIISSGKSQWFSFFVLQHKKRIWVFCWFCSQFAAPKWPS